MRTLLFLLVALAFAGADADRSGAAPPKPSPERDPRLKRTVRLLTPRVYLGEALEDLGRQAGVSLKVPDRPDPASDLELAFSITGRPLSAPRTSGRSSGNCG